MNELNINNESQTQELINKIAIKIKIRELEVSKNEWKQAFNKLASFVRNGFLNDELTIYEIDKKIKEYRPTKNDI